MTMLTAVDECTDCTAGYYCETPGLTEPTGPCDEGELTNKSHLYQRTSTSNAFQHLLLSIFEGSDGLLRFRLLLPIWSKHIDCAAL